MLIKFVKLFVIRRLVFNMIEITLHEIENCSVKCTVEPEKIFYSNEFISNKLHEVKIENLESI